MRRTLKPEEARLWSVVTGTVRPARTTRAPQPEAEGQDHLAPAAHLPIEAMKPLVASLGKEQVKRIVDLLG